MVKRTLLFAGAVALAAAVTVLVYLNPQESSFRISRENSLELPLGILMLGAAAAGATIVFAVGLMREGRRALRDWRVHRQMRTADRTTQYRNDARSLLLAGEYAKARTLFTKAGKLADTDVHDLLEYAESYLLEGRHSQARKVLEDGQREFGNDPLLLFAIARAYRRTADDSAAIVALERAIAVYPRSRQLLTELRDALFATGAWKRGGEIQERLAAARPEDKDERNRLLGARYEAAMNEEDESLRSAMLREVNKTDPSFCPALVERVRLMSQAGESRQALRLLERAVRTAPRAVLLDELERVGEPHYSSRLRRLYRKLSCAKDINERLRDRVDRYLTQGAVARGGPSGNGDGPAVALQVCAECERPSFAWMPRCPGCGVWDSIDTGT